MSHWRSSVLVHHESQTPGEAEHHRYKIRIVVLETGMKNLTLETRDLHSSYGKANAILTQPYFRSDLLFAYSLYKSILIGHDTSYALVRSSARANSCVSERHRAAELFSAPV